MKKLTLIAFSLLFAAFSVIPVNAATYTIADGDVAGLIAAIHAANANPGADTINLAPGGTYTLNQVDNGDYWTGPSGLPLISGELTINGTGATIQRSSANGIPPFRIIYSYGYLTLKDVTIRGGKSAAGAPGYIGGGGGIRNGGGRLVIVGSTITENSGSEGGANDGGGIINYGGSLTLINSTISHNIGWGGYGGGGILNFSHGGIATTTVSNSTIYENRANAPAGFKGRGDAIADAFSPVGSIVVKNSIVASPTQGLGNDCYPSGPLSQGHNIFSDTSCGQNVPGGDLIEPALSMGPLADNGGPTPTHALLPGSPAIDAIPLADCTSVAGAPVLTDQRGYVRPQGGLCDIGSFEADDSDNDGVSDGADNCPLTANADQADTDGDGAGNACDADDDNDGVPDANDAFPLDPNESIDTDGDGTGNNADTDDDGDGVSDTAETAAGSDPLNSASTPEICDGADNDLNEGIDERFTNTDNDALADCVDPDDDNDGVTDTADNCPLTANANQADFDLDGIGDACDPQTGPPTNMDQCKDYGWMRFDVPRRFNNQGDCIQFVITGR